MGLFCFSLRCGIFFFNWATSYLALKFRAGSSQACSQLLMDISAELGNRFTVRGQEWAQAVKSPSRFGTARTESHTSLPSHTQKPHPPPALLTKATSLRAAALRLSQWVGVRGRRRLKAAAAPDEPRWGDKKYELCLTTSIWGSCSEQEKWQFLLSMFCPACLLFVYFSLPVRLAFTKEWRKNTEKFSEREGRDGKTKKAALLQLPAFPNSVPARPALRQQFLCRYSYPSIASQRRLTATV